MTSILDDGNVDSEATVWNAYQWSSQQPALAFPDINQRSAEMASRKT